MNYRGQKKSYILEVLMAAQAVSVSDKSDKCVFTVSNVEGEEIENIPFDIIILHEKPSLLNKEYTLAFVSNKTLLVNKGSFSYIAQHNLNIIDFKNNGTFFRYLVRVPPRCGNLELKGRILGANGTFKQEEINSGQVCYRHDSSKEASWDFFVFDVIDIHANVINSDAFPIKMVRDNTAPVFVNKRPLQVIKSSETVIGTPTLSVVDDEQGPEVLTYEVVSLPLHGTLKSKKAGLLKQGNCFTQEEIDHHMITYTHGGESMEVDNFTFTVNDGAGGVTEKTTLVFYVYESEADFPKIDPQETQKNKEEGGDAKAAAPKESQTAEGEGSAPILFPVNFNDSVTICPKDINTFFQGAQVGSREEVEILTLPKYGEILRKHAVVTKQGKAGRGLAVGVGDKIGMQEFQEGLISYLHEGKATAPDEFHYHIIKHGKVAQKRSLHVTIVEENNAPVLLENETLRLKKRDEIPVEKINLGVTDQEQGPSELEYTLRKIPEQGSLLFNHKLVTVGGTFSQEDILQGRVFYHHTGGDEKEDKVIFSVSDGVGGVLDHVMLSVLISSISYSILFNNPLSVTAKGAVPFTGNNLRTTLRGESESKVKYTLSSAPAKGSIVVDGKPLDQGEYFTQKQIFAGEVIYQHKG